MRKITFLVLFMLFSIVSFGQFNAPNRIRPFVNTEKYQLVDSLLLERVQTYVPDSMLIEHIQEHSSKRLKENEIIQLGSYEYMFELPKKDNIVVRYTNDKTKAVVINSSIIQGMGLHFFEFNVQDNKRRQILYYDDDNILCGLIYDKEYKVAKYFRYEKKEVGKRQFRRMRRTFRRNF